MDTNDIIITELHEFSSDVADTLRELAQQVGKNYKDLTDEDVREMLSYSHLTIYVARDKESEQIMGMVTLIVQRIPYVRKATMEDLVVDETFRGRGIGTKLIQKVIEEAKRKGASYLDFSSRPRREGENALYEKLGFIQRETNVYRHIFDYREV